MGLDYKSHIIFVQLLHLLHAYSAIFRRHHLRQQKMAEGLAILEKHKFFSGSSYAKLVQIAFSMQCITVSSRKQLVAAGSTMQSAYVISKGSVTVFAASPKKNNQLLKSANGGVFGSLRLAVAQWGHGFMIGELEVGNDQDTFACSYETSTECELYEIPRKDLEVCMCVGLI